MGRVKETAYECWELASAAWYKGEEPDWERIGELTGLDPETAEQWAKGWEDLND